jgi:hypothetical protein
MGVSFRRVPVGETVRLRLLGILRDSKGGLWKGSISHCASSVRRIWKVGGGSFVGDLEGYGSGGLGRRTSLSLGALLGIPLKGGLSTGELSRLCKRSSLVIRAPLKIMEGWSVHQEL